MTYTEDINLLALEYNQSVADGLKEIISPIFKHLGFTHFTYSRFKEGNRYLSLNVDLNLLRDYFKTDLDTYVLFNGVEFPKYTKKSIIWDLQPSMPLMEYMRKHGYFHGVSIYFRQDEIIEAWHFATTADNEGINSFYTNNLSYLERFIAYFQDKAYDLISPQEKNWAIFTDGRSLSLETPEKEKMLTEASLDHFLEAIRMQRFPFELDNTRVFLTPSEFECFGALAEGLTLKAIAQRKNISPRTVESHIQNVKTKLDLHSKTSLITEYRKSIYSQMSF